jgi:sodium/hydrogen antiporter
MPDAIMAMALVGVVLLISALVSGVVERIPVSFPMIFLGLGFILGEHGLGILHVDVHNAALETIATLSLAFVLFLDALNLEFDKAGREWVVPVLALGPGTLLTVLFISVASALLLRATPIQALLLGGLLSSVDPVLLREVVADERIPRSIRQALKMEAGANDIIVLPIILILARVSLGQTGGIAQWAMILLRLFALGPLAGVAVGFVTDRLLKVASSHHAISREYRALYGIGGMLVAYVAGEAVGGSGFLAVFAAGWALVALDHDICDCFLEYGAVTAEMTMLLAFVLFGALLSTIVLTVPLLPALGLAFVTLVVARPAAIGIVLRHAPISTRGRQFIGWFGPRGLSSLLFGLLLVTYGVPGAEGLLAVVGIVVIVSAIAHGASAAPMANRYMRAVAAETLAEERESTGAGLFLDDPGDVPRVTPGRLEELLAGDGPPIVLDVRSRSSYERDRTTIPGSIRVQPDQIAEWAAQNPPGRLLVTFCT